MSGFPLICEFCGVEQDDNKQLDITASLRQARGIREYRHGPSPIGRQAKIIMGLFGKKKKEENVPEPAASKPTPPPPNPFPDTPTKVNPYAKDATFVPTEYKSRVTPSQDPLEDAAQKKKARDTELLNAIFGAFAKMLPTYGTNMKKFAPLTTTDYEFNEGNYDDRYKDLGRKIKEHMEQKGWKVKDFQLKNSKERSPSTLTKFYPSVKWDVMEPGSFKIKK